MQQRLNVCGPRTAALALALVWLAGCTPPPPPPPPGPPQFPGFLFPTVPESMAGLPIVTDHLEAWRRLQAGDLLMATAGFVNALEQVRTFYPAEAGLGYVDLAATRFDDAVARFGAVLERAPAYAPAWVGRGEALLGARREVEALAAYESALAADPSLGDIRRRIEVLRFRSVQSALESALAAERAERFGDARQAYERALTVSPDSGVLYRGLAGVEQRLGELAPALDHVRRANRLEPDDPQGLSLEGEILEAFGDLEGAEAAFDRAARLDPTAERRANLDRVRRRLATAALPPPYRAIPEAPEITRGELAAVVAVRLERLLNAAPRDEAVLMTDTRSHWADPWILAAAQAGVMEVFPNHTFQPESVVDRGGLAEVAARVLTLIAVRDPGRGTAWQTARYPFADLDPGHLQYPAASMAVAADVLTVLEGNRFGLANAVSGLEAVAAVEELARIASP